MCLEVHILSTYLTEIIRLEPWGMFDFSPRKQICVTDRHDMTLDVKVALNSNTTNQPTNQPIDFSQGY